MPKAIRIHAHGGPEVMKWEDFVEKIKDITDGRGVNVVYDSVGQATFMKSLECLQALGTMVTVLWKDARPRGRPF